MEETWYKLDNAAKIYPAVKEEKWSPIFRVDAILKSEVNPKLLQAALLMIYKRFPTLSVHISKGLFWYYFEPNESEPEIKPENSYPTRPFTNKRDKGYLYRVLYYNNRISLEMFHAISDGYGAIIFLKTLLFNYFTLVNAKEPIDDVLELEKYGIFYYKDLPTQEETEDSFKRYALKSTKLKLHEDPAFKIPGTKLKNELVRITHILVSVKALCKLAKDYDTTITQFITSLYIYSILNSGVFCESEKKPIKISVPMNLRSRFPSKSIRNFSSYINVEVYQKSNGEKIELNEICEAVKNQLQEGAEIDKLHNKFSSNVNVEKKMMMRITPLIIKKAVLKTTFSLYGERITTSTVSNIGNITLPEKMIDFVERFDAVMGAPKKNSLSCAVTSYEDTISITFTSIIIENTVLKKFVDFLVAHEIDVSIETNY